MCINKLHKKFITNLKINGCESKFAQNNYLLIFGSALVQNYIFVYV